MGINKMDQQKNKMLRWFDFYFITVTGIYLIYRVVVFLKRF